MLKNILWMAGGLALGLSIWAVYDQIKKAKAKKAAEAAAAAAALEEETAKITNQAPVKPAQLANLTGTTNNVGLTTTKS
jgi:peptidoglycan hydrolase CwlO-like protein